MSLEFVACPVCKQKLALFDYMTIGADVVCANPECLTYLRIEGRKPLKLSVIPDRQTYNADTRPESYD
jgi:uncharacterized protein YbaR (Trm112 family)